MTTSLVRHAVRPMRALAGIIAASVTIRIVLVLSGGQAYWPDEGRYYKARRIVQLLASGRVDEIVPSMEASEHPLFKLVAVVPAFIEHLTHEPNTKIAALFLAMCSVVNIWLVGRIWRRMGAGEWEAVLASCLLALSATFFYWARHLVPYDLSLTLGLLAILAGCRRDRWRASFFCGFFAGCGFLTYAGSWTLGAAAMAMHLLRFRTVRDLLPRAALTGLGLLLPLGSAIVPDMAFGSGRLVEDFAFFSRSVTEGEFSEGWRLPFDYLWAAEHLLLPVWMLALLSCVGSLLFGEGTPARIRQALAGVVLIYGALALLSTVSHTFVVYGRLARQVVPFLCMITAYELTHLWSSPTRSARIFAPTLLVAMLIQAVANFSQPLRQWFPREFIRETAPLVAGLAHREWLWINTEHTPRPVALPEKYTVLRAAAHPLEYAPYQYEGFPPPNVWHCDRPTSACAC